MRKAGKIRFERLHPHAWIWEPLESDATFVLRAMFGTKAVYLEGRLIFCFAAKTEPWSGVLVATDRQHHPSMISEIPALTPHPILSKWLYLSESFDSFEREARHLIILAKQGDGRLGVVPRQKKEIDLNP
ncbi:MAG: hypothetical protein WCP60_06345 [bacterium]